MRSQRTLRHWVQALLPQASPCAHQGAWTLLRALLVSFTVDLAQLARQADRATSAKGTGQYLRRWLNHPAWEPTVLYAGLARLYRRWLRRQRQVLLLIDTTCLTTGWVVLQVSLPWQRRALPVFRVVYPYAGPERDQPGALALALTFLERHLPGPRRRYVLVLDRGFPSSEAVRRWQERGWRFVVRVKGNWRLESPTYAGPMREAPLEVDVPRFYADVVVGTHDPRQGPDRRGRAHVVHYHGSGHQEPWYLVTNEPSAWTAIRIYGERMRIEQEFRDLKGPLGLDRLAAWESLDRVARFLAWVAVYEWRLAYYWLVEHLAAFAVELRVGGKLSWIRTAREWVQRHIRQLGAQAFEGL